MLPVSVPGVPSGTVYHQVIYVSSCIHCMIVWIYNIFTTDQMWYKCVSKYGICDINNVEIINDSFTIAEMSNTQYLHTQFHHI